MPLVGRQTTLRVLQEALDATAEGEFRFVALVGEPGAGKSRLLGELSAAAEERKLTALSGRAAEFEQEMPFGAVVDAMDDLLEEDRPDLAPGTLQMLGTVFPSLADAAPQLAPSGEAHTGHETGSGVARYQLHRNVRHLLELLAAKSNGLVVVLDDLHWADEATIELLDHVVRHPPRARVLVAVAYRPAQASPRLAGLIDAATVQGTHVPVDPLTQAEVQEFLGPQVSRARCDALYTASGGNPFYLEALARMGPGQEEALGAGDAELHSWEMGVAELTEVPLTVRTALQIELSALPSDALLLARAAAVAADEFEPTLAAVAAEMDTPQSLAALDILTKHDVVRATPTGRFRFRHPIVRHVAYASTAAGWRLAAHDRVARHLAELGASAAVRAHHVVRSARFGDRAAIGTLTEAARVVAPQAPATAAHWLQAALKLMPAEAPGEPHAPAGAEGARSGRIELLLELAHVQTYSGQAEEARETAHELLRLLPSSDTVRRAAVVHLCARMERQLGRVHEARALVLDELRGITDRQTPEAVLLRIRLVADRVQRADIRGAQAVLDTIPESLPEWGAGLKTGVASMRPMASYVGGNFDQAISYAETADHLFSAASDNDFADCLDCVLWLVWAEIFLGRYDDALRHVMRLVSIARTTGQTYILGYLLAAQARVLALQGRLAEAAASADEASAVGRQLRSDEVMGYGLTQQSLVASMRGDHDQAVRLGQEAAACDTGSSEWWARMAHCAHALAIIGSGRLEVGAAALVEACGDGTQGLDISSLVICAEALAAVRAAQDRPAEASDWAGIAEELSFPQFGGDIGLSRLARARAVQAAEPERAAALAIEAADLLRAAGRLPEAGRAELTAGLAYATAGQREPGRARLRAAAEIFESCGMEAMHAQTMREQRRLGVRVAGAARPGGPRPGGKDELPFGLSPREYEVAGLVAEGYSNQQIAERLFLSVRTVETHLSRVFAKVGVGSRVAVATAMNRQS